jgi:hypothetical protein
MVEEVTRAAIRARVEELAKEAGLKRNGLAASLGEGLCRLWGIDPESDDTSARKGVLPEFEKMIDGIPDSSPQKYLMLAGRLSFNISTYTEGNAFGYTDRQRCLDKKFRSKNKLSDISGPPRYISRTLNSVIAYTNQVYDRLADVLSEAWCKFAPDEPFPRDEGEAEESTHFEQATYVWRNDYYVEFKKFVDSGARLIALIGQPGIGKTSLAMMLTTGREQSEGYVPVIEVNRGKPSIEHLRAASHRLRRPIRSGSMECLAELLYGDSPPPFVVLDNLESADELNRLVPTPPQSVVVATCRTRGLTPPDYCQFIDVDTMTEEESRQLIARELPEVSELDARRMTDSLYGYPLLMRHVCGLLRNQNISVRDFCRDLRADASKFVGGIRLKEGRTLAAVLERVVEEVRAHDALAYELLACISFVGEGDGDVREIHQAFLADYLALSQAQSVSNGRYAEAVDLLYRYSLIQFRRDPRRRIGVIIHPFTEEILRTFFDSQVVRIAHCAGQVIARQEEKFLQSTLAAGGTTELAEKIGSSGGFIQRMRAKLRDALNQQLDYDASISVVNEAHRIYRQVRFFAAIAVQLAPHSAEIANLSGFAAVIGRDHGNPKFVSWGEGEPSEMSEMMSIHSPRIEAGYMLTDLINKRDLEAPIVVQKMRAFDVLLDEFNT